MRRSAALLALLAVAVTSGAGLPAFGQQPPASMAEVAITSGGSRINGLVYLAPGTDRKPVVIFLHGYPGNEKNLDLAQAVRRAGYQAVYFDYRGIFGSGGTFSFTHGLEDTKAILAWVREPKNAATYHFDVNRIALVGHSFGGWLALTTARTEAPQVCVAALAAWNIGYDAARVAANPQEKAATLVDFRGSTDPTGGPVHAEPEDLVDEMIAHASEWDYAAHAASLGDRALLLVGATNDSPDEDVTMLRRLETAVRAAGARRVSLINYDDDHPFSAHRLELADALTKWLDADCAQSQRK